MQEAAGDSTSDIVKKKDTSVSGIEDNLTSPLPGIIVSWNILLVAE